ncbi:transcription regulator, partial [Tanacetum coccineum]
TRPQGTSFLSDLKQKLLLSPSEAARAGTRYNVPLMNSLVLYVGMQGNIAVTSNETNLVARCRRVYAHAHDYHINSISNNSWVIRAQLEVNTARLKKLVLLAEVSTASRVITAGVLLILLEY